MIICLVLCSYAPSKEREKDRNRKVSHHLWIQRCQDRSGLFLWWWTCTLTGSLQLTASLKGEAHSFFRTSQKWVWALSSPQAPVNTVIEVWPYACTSIASEGLQGDFVLSLPKCSLRWLSLVHSHSLSPSSTTFACCNSADLHRLHKIRKSVRRNTLPLQGSICH